MRKRYDYYTATIGGLLVAIRYIGLSNGGRLTTLRLFYDYFIGETTTISAGTLRLLLTSIGYRAKARKELRREPPMVPRRPPRLCRWTAPPGGVYRADPVQVETLTPQRVRRVCTADSVSALASDLRTVGVDPAGLAWSVIRCTVWHGSIIGGAPLPLIYLIIIGGLY